MNTSFCQSYFNSSIMGLVGIKVGAAFLLPALILPTPGRVPDPMFT